MNVKGNLHGSSKILSIGLAGFPITSDPKQNWKLIQHLTRQSVEQNARLVVFAEGALSGYYGEHFKHSDHLDMAQVDRLNEQLKELAREYKVFLVVGTITQKRSCFYNTLLALGPDGEEVARYDKRHLLKRDREFYTAGRSPALFEVDGHVVGLQICFDVRFPLWAHEYAKRGAEVLIYAANMCGKRGVWKRPVMEGHLRSRAAENSVFVAAINDLRPYPNLPVFAADPGGQTIVNTYPRSFRTVVTDLDFSVHYPIEEEIVAEYPTDYKLIRSWRQGK